MGLKEKLKKSKQQWQADSEWHEQSPLDSSSKSQATFNSSIQSHPASNGFSHDMGSDYGENLEQDENIADHEAEKTIVKPKDSQINEQPKELSEELSEELNDFLEHDDDIDRNIDEKLLEQFPSNRKIILDDPVDDTIDDSKQTKDNTQPKNGNNSISQPTNNELLETMDQDISPATTPAIPEEEGINATDDTTNLSEEAENNTTTDDETTDNTDVSPRSLSPYEGEPDRQRRSISRFELRGNRIILRCLQDDDVKHLWRWMGKNPVINRLGLRIPINKGELNAWITSNLKKHLVEQGIFIIEQEDRIPIGLCALFNLEPSARRAEYCIIIGDHNYRGHGYGHEATSLILELAFNHINLNRIEALILFDDDRSVYSLQKNGFKKEGELYEYTYINGEYKNIYIISILRSEYEQFLAESEFA